jgi:hypothetical protein
MAALLVFYAAAKGPGASAAVAVVLGLVVVAVTGIAEALWEALRDALVRRVRG